jgi:hypothetical protein
MILDGEFTSYAYAAASLVAPAIGEKSGGVKLAIPSVIP